MKLYNPHTYEKLGFDVVLRRVQDYLASEEAREAVMSIVPVSDPSVLVPELKRTEEYRNMLSFDEAMPGATFVSVTRILRKAAVQGNWLTTQELFQLVNWLRSIRDIRRYMHQRREVYPHLDAWVNAGTFQPGLIGEIDKILDDAGNMRDNASPELNRIRRSLTTTAAELRNTLYRVLRRANENNWSLDKEITIRNDRLVIPVKADAKGRVPGFIQDVSQSGNTVYVEPAEALPLNNELRELQIREHNEMVRILTEVTARVFAEVETLLHLREMMQHLELVQAKARLALDLEAVLPVITPEGQVLRLIDARYPLLVFRQAEGLQVIPLAVELAPNHRVMVISGPNAGGKSVSLKTIGLLQLMLQCGFLLPVNEGSVFPLFESLFMDIGDEQSVESDLSTYTSRLFLWRQMGDHMDGRSLFLIDEFGSGTDPKQGGAIAEAFLERFVNQRAYGVITTHYGNLKDYAEITPGAMNAAMQFDTQGLRPTYRLIEGMPGRSYAFEMARRVGVHPTILKKARKKVGVDEIETENLLQELERKNVELSRLVLDNKREEARLQQLIQQYETQQKALDKNRKDLMREAKLQARELLRQANQQIESTIREIRAAQAEQTRTIQLRRELAAAIPEVTPEEEDMPAEEQVEVLAEPLVAGDWARLKNSESSGQIIEIQGKRVILESGEIRLAVKLSQLEKIRPPARRKSTISVALRGEMPASTARYELDVKGMRVENALVEVDKLLDQARLAGLNQVRILHGKGTGALRESIRGYISKLPFVQEARDAHVDDGGAGWTIVDLTD
ncbi:MAG: endonuclease MutS2 [Bacteroidia bacterium]|nr:endonuclease MutS2 [Bacteroidia bacterium]